MSVVRPIASDEQRHCPIERRAIAFEVGIQDVILSDRKGAKNLYSDICHLNWSIDGHSHGAQVEYDEARTAWLEERGYKVVRFTNDQIHRHLNAVLAEIVRQCDSWT